jgi:hypothetical protein
MQPRVGEGKEGRVDTVGRGGQRGPRAAGRHSRVILRSPRSKRRGQRGAGTTMGFHAQLVQIAQNSIIPLLQVAWAWLPALHLFANPIVRSRPAALCPSAISIFSALLGLLQLALPQCTRVSAADPSIVKSDFSSVALFRTRQSANPGTELEYLL